MAKRKVFEKVEQNLPVTGAKRSATGVIQFPVALPPAVTAVEIGRTSMGLRTFDFKDYYGHGVDEITFAFQRQIERFVEGEDRKLATKSIHTICTGASPFLDYLIARSTVEHRQFVLTDINRTVIDGYLSWLRDSGNSESTQDGYYKLARTVLSCLGKRGLFAVVDTGDNRLFPKNPFPGADRSKKGEIPLTKAERQALASALRKVVLPLFHSDAILDSYRLTAALLLVALHTGRNLTPLLEMPLDCLRPHPKEGMLFLSLFKRRGYREQQVVLRDENNPVDKIDLTPTIRSNVAALIRHIIALGAPLRAEGPAHLKDRVWVYRTNRDSFITELLENTLRANIAKLVKDHQLTDAEGKPLRLNISRLRKTFVNRMYEILDGNIITTAVAAGHSAPRVTGINYLRPGEHAERNWKFMGELLTEELLTGTIDKTPLAHCSNPRSGQYVKKQDGSTCTNFLNCLRCRNFVVTKDDLFKLFSFEQRILKEIRRIDKRKWKKNFSHIPRLIERDVIRPGLKQKKFKPAEVEAARKDAKTNPHPFWRADSLIADLEAMA